MRRYLFIGGPWDGQWRAIPDERDIWRVPIMADLSRATFLDVEEVPMRDALYYRQRALVPGWLVPLTFYTTDPLLPIPSGTALPGSVQGMRSDAELCGGWRYVDLDEPLHYLHVAVRSWNRRDWWTR